MKGAPTVLNQWSRDGGWRHWAVSRRARRHALFSWILIALLVPLSGCQAAVPDRRPDVDRLSKQLGAMPGVHAVGTDYSNSSAQGMVLFRIHTDVADTVTADQLAAIVERYLQDLRAGTYRGYHTELEVRRGWNVFAVDSSDRSISNAAQIVGQARDWVALRDAFPGATVTLRATIAHPSGPLAAREIGKSNLATIELPDTADANTVADAVGVVANRFAHLAEMNWTVTAGKEPTQIAFTRRLPTAAELTIWRRLAADQGIAHVDAMRINGPVTPPVWISEKTTSTDDAAVALQLATRHLPIAATLPAPVLYTASDQIYGHIGGYGFSRGPLAVTVGGCTPRDPLVYQPTPAEEALIRQYETCYR